MIDDLCHTTIVLSCYRDTNRLDRLLRVFHAALEAAHSDGKAADLRSQLVGLHDHSGELEIFWKGQPEPTLWRYVAEAWTAEGEDEDSITNVIAAVRSTEMVQ